MQFIFAMLQKVAAGTEANKAAKEAYAETLSKHHNFIVKKAFEVGLMGAPSTDTMLTCLGSDKVCRSLPGGVRQGMPSPPSSVRCFRDKLIHTRLSFAKQAHRALQSPPSHGSGSYSRCYPPSPAAPPHLPTIPAISPPAYSPPTSARASAHPRS